MLLLVPLRGGIFCLDFFFSVHYYHGEQGKEWCGNIMESKGKSAVVKKLVLYPSPFLRKKSLPVEDPQEVKVLLWSMVETMYENDGIGLAGVQVGELKRVLVMDTSRPLGFKAPVLMIHPAIESTSPEQVPYEEGCLSIPGQKALVMRPKEVTVTYTDLHGKRQFCLLGGLSARCFQHELDHLNGILFIDHLSNLKRHLLLKSYQKKQTSSDSQ